ncbi:MAG: glycogen synthase [Acidobacteriota bacterium]|jgi:glycosyltransferase involved in cell wall biosynthesis|nr:glycogen synthase [Acidobacteriota bacterium]
MRVLVISNLYPPHHLGGYELSCQETVERFKARGHQVCVLTSTYGVGSVQTEGEVYRWLETSIAWEQLTGTKRVLRLLKKEAHNQRALRKAVRRFDPDLIYIWNLTGLSVSLALRAQRMKLSTHYYVFDKWLSMWRSDPWYSLWPYESRRPLVRFGSWVLQSSLKAFGIISAGRLDLRRAQFASRFLKRVTLEAGESVAGAPVIYWGIEIEKFPYKRGRDKPTRLLFVGQVGPHKGVHTAIEAVRILVEDYGCTSIKFTVVGGSILPDYVLELRQLVRSHGLDDYVDFFGFADRDQLPNIFQAHDILLFPSICDEGLGITLLEAMSSGLAVLGTASGGSAEVLAHEINGLVFPKEDARACADQVLRLLNDNRLYEEMRANGRRTVEERFRIERTIEHLEQALQAGLPPN